MSSVSCETRLSAAVPCDALHCAAVEPALAALADEGTSEGVELADSPFGSVKLRATCGSEKNMARRWVKERRTEPSVRTLPDEVTLHVLCLAVAKKLQEDRPAAAAACPTLLHLVQAAVKVRGKLPVNAVWNAFPWMPRQAVVAKWRRIIDVKKMRYEKSGGRIHGLSVFKTFRSRLEERIDAGQLTLWDKEKMIDKYGVETFDKYKECLCMTLEEFKIPTHQQKKKQDAVAGMLAMAVDAQ